MMLFTQACLLESVYVWSSVCYMSWLSSPICLSSEKEAYATLKVSPAS